ncbi:anti-sigma-F factor Fin [Sporomusa sp. GT1]|uniref:anti-sigma-F factor Fin n=1 Tax=Sporomusa sp. GT1 TaxID=1534747 RepID=UPI00166749A0|nr:anti-sigma-F factor Fin [Sporomusa sp. GT1]
MKIFYTCEYCNEPIDTLEVDQVDEAKFGFDCLTAQERQDIIKIDAAQNAMYVKSLCDSCIAAMGLEDTIGLGMTTTANKSYIH